MPIQSSELEMLNAEVMIYLSAKELPLFRPLLCFIFLPAVGCTCFYSFQSKMLPTAYCRGLSAGHWEHAYFSREVDT